MERSLKRNMDALRISTLRAEFSRDVDVREVLGALVDIMACRTWCYLADGHHSACTANVRQNSRQWPCER